MSSGDSHASFPPASPPTSAKFDSASAEESAMPLASVLRVSGGLRAIFGSPGYKPPMLPSVALEIHDLSCRPDIDTEKLVALLERDPMLAAHVLRVANSPMFRGRDAETSLRSAVLRLGLKNLGEIVFEIALHMRVFRSAEYSGMMEELRRHSTACANLCRLLASSAGLDSEHAFLCGLLHDIGMAAVLIVLSERRKSETALEPVVLAEVLSQIHEDVSAMLVRQWKLPDEVAEVVGCHHGMAAVTKAPLLSSVVALADALTARFKFAVDLGPRSSERCDGDVFEAATTKLRLDLAPGSALEKEVRQTLAHVDEALKHKGAIVTEESQAQTAKPAKKVSSPHSSASPASKVASAARKDRPSWLGRLGRAVRRMFS
jgi:putative nucleotidyltransferase with HDIG domain